MDLKVDFCLTTSASSFPYLQSTWQIMLFLVLFKLFAESARLYLNMNNVQSKLSSYCRSQVPDTSDLASLACQIETELKKQSKVLERLQSEVVILCLTMEARGAGISIYAGAYIINSCPFDH